MPRPSRKSENRNILQSVHGISLWDKIWAMVQSGNNHVLDWTQRILNFSHYLPEINIPFLPTTMISSSDRLCAEYVSPSTWTKYQPFLSNIIISFPPVSIRFHVHQRQDIVLHSFSDWSSLIISRWTCHLAIKTQSIGLCEGKQHCHTWWSISIENNIKHAPLILRHQRINDSRWIVLNIHHKPRQQIEGYIVSSMIHDCFNLERAVMAQVEQYIGYLHGVEDKTICPHMSTEVFHLTNVSGR